MPHRRKTAASPPLPNRPGPRPLPLHLLTHASTLLGSRVALPLWRKGSLPWNPALADKARDLKALLDDAGPDAWDRLDQAVAIESLARHQAMLDGIEAYRRHPYRRALPPPPVLWQEGTTQLLDYRTPEQDGPPLLVVPSLINRAYILDLSEQRSVMRALAAKGISPFLLDWNAPGPEERTFDLATYITGRLSQALDQVIAACGRPPILLGYCMGGDLSLAMACLRPRDLAGLVLLATPWDFHAGREAHAILMRALASPLGGLIDAMGQFPVDLLQSMFSSLDPNLMARKYAAFARLPQKSARARDFVALEDWANDGVALAAPVARECLFHWYGANEPLLGLWRIGTQSIRPESLGSLPALLMVPQRDRIVPPQSALPLARSIPNARTVMVGGGHVGMLINKRAGTCIYTPLAKWIMKTSIP